MQLPRGPGTHTHLEVLPEAETGVVLPHADAPPDEILEVVCKGRTSSTGSVEVNLPRSVPTYPVRVRHSRCFRVVWFLPQAVYAI